jgi:hypothetical protein
VIDGEVPIATTVPKTKWWIRNFGVGKLDDQLQLNGSSIQPWTPLPTTGVTDAVTLWQLHPALDAAADHRVTAAVTPTAISRISPPASAAPTAAGVGS